MRIEKDFIGKKKIPKKALYGIHSLRAKENFPNQNSFHIEWYQAVGEVKKACYGCYQDFKNSAVKEYSGKYLPIHFFNDELINALLDSAEQVAQGDYFDHFMIPAVQGGAGTSINMNINEIISNVALRKLGHLAGEYSMVDPLEHANVYQSTNDVIPTALKIAVMRLLKKLEDSINQTRHTIEKLENKYRDLPRLAYTQLQEAVPSTYGRLFSAYSDALSRDWWRVSKAWERIKVVNLGGGAIGTGLAIPRFFIMNVVNHLKRITALPLSRSENAGDTTSNLDSFVEVSAIIKAHAVNLEKMSSDLRLLAADISNTHLCIPQKQLGSSIMPAKVNPVIVEFVISSCHKIYANDQLITTLSAKGDLELNAYLPTIGDALLANLKLLIAANISINKNLLEEMTIDTQATKEDFYKSPVVTTVLSPIIGYHRASELAKLMKQKGISIFDANKMLKFIDDQKLRQMMKPEHLTSLGFSLNDI